MKENYPGQKAIDGVLQKLVNVVPVHSVFVELFAGSAALSQALYGSDLSVPQGNAVLLNDLAYFSVLDVNNCTGHSRDSVFCALDLTVINDSLANNRLLFSSNCAVDLLQLFSSIPDQGVVLFADPPYLHETRPSNTKLYQYEMSYADHCRFISSVLQSSHNCIVIHPECDLYNDSFSSWRSMPVKIRYNRKTSHERIWCNFSAELPLHSYALLGVDSWDRQRIKRKVTRHLSKLRSLPIQEQRALVSAIVDEFYNF